MAAVLKQSAVSSICNAIDKITAERNRIPGCVFVVVNKDERTLFEHASGKRGADMEEPMTLDSIFWIESCTKMICGVAAMQLCEQGKLSLDDPDKVDEGGPELKTIRILRQVDEHGKPELVDKTNRITMEMLLTHTGDWGQPLGCDEFSGHQNDVLGQLLVFEPGTDWQYGVGVDWAGTVIERISGMSLNDNIQKNIFQPLGIKNINMFPPAETKHMLAHMHHKDPYGTIRERNHPLRRPLIIEGEDISKTCNSAGAGCFARPAEYCEILAALLNSGISPTTQNRILSAASIEEMFTNQIPQFPDFGRKRYPPEQPQGWGISFMLTDHEGGQNTAWWAGLAILFWRCDREKGIAGMCASQVLPFGDPEVVGLWVYANLEQGCKELPIR